MIKVVGKWWIGSWFTGRRIFGLREGDEVDEGESTIVSADELYGDESDMGELAGIEFTGAETSGEEVSEKLADEPKTIEEKPSNAPPVPESGLPEGWTMEQWEWYGHEWLAKYGEK